MSVARFDGAAPRCDRVVSLLAPPTRRPDRRHPIGLSARLFPARRPAAREPGRAQSLGIETLEERARAFAAELGPGRIDGRRRGTHLRRLERNAERLRDAYRLLAEDVHRSEALPPAAEWLLDNFHMVEAEVRNVAHDLPEGYHRELAQTVQSGAERRTRIELVAEDLLAHSDGRLETARVTRYLAAFQTVEALSIG